MSKTNSLIPTMQDLQTEWGDKRYVTALSKMTESLKQVLIRRDGMTPADAEDLIAEAKDDLDALLQQGGAVEDAYLLIEDFFGLEPDYLDDLIF